MTAPLRSVWDYAGLQVDPGTPLTNADPKIQALIDSGAINQTSHDYSNESGSGTITENNVDWANPNLPAMGPPGVGNKYGNWLPVEFGGRTRELLNPGMTFDDPNYGLITPSTNLKPDKKDWLDYLGPAYMALLTMGVGALPAFGAEAAMTAGAAGAVAGDAFLPGALSGLYGASTTPWYISAGLNAAKAIGGAGGSDSYGSPATAAPKAVPVPTHPGTTLPMEFMPSNFGGSGTPMSVPDGSAPVATSVAPDAYNASNNSVGYNQVVV